MGLGEETGCGRCFRHFFSPFWLLFLLELPVYKDYAVLAYYSHYVASPKGRHRSSIREAQNLGNLATVISPFAFHAPARFPRALSLIADFHLSDFCVYFSVGSELEQGEEMI